MYKLYKIQLLSFKNIIIVVDMGLEPISPPFIGGLYKSIS